MKIIFLLFFILINCSIEKTELLPITSKDLMEKINKFKGDKAVLVNIWALWCQPCVEEFPMIVNFQKENIDLEILFVNADFINQSQNVSIFLSEQNVRPFSYIKNEKDEPFINGVHSGWSGSLPFTIVFAKESGIMIDNWEGKEPKSRFDHAISEALIN